MFMPFGKHDGKPVSELPDGYLEWAVKTLTDVDADLRRALMAEYIARAAKRAAREGGRPQTPPAAALPVAVSVDLALEIVKAGRRALALSLHPDKGGDAERMTLCNATADFLEKRLPQMLAGRN